MPEASTDIPVIPDPVTLVAQLRDLLNVAVIDDDIYCGARQPGGRGRVFGGQVIAQGLMAAMRTVDPDRIVHSLHAYFMRAGDEQAQIAYKVDRDYDGGSFSTRRITALQHSRPILTMTASFQKLEPGFHHADPMPDVPPPEALMTESERIAAETDPVTAELMTRFQRMRPIEIRPVESREFVNPTPRPPLANSWIRLVAPIGDDANEHRAMLAYASDMALLGTCLLPHGANWRTPGMMSASLDHAVWLHDDFRIDDWLLYVTDSPWAGRARGFNRGRFYTRDGRLVANVAQEGLIRLRPPKD